MLTHQVLGAEDTGFLWAECVVAPAKPASCVAGERRRLGQALRTGPGGWAAPPAGGVLSFSGGKAAGH